MALFLFILWIVLNGRITLEIVLFGIAVSAAVSIFLYRLAGYPALTDWKILRNLPLFLIYLIVLFVEIVKASLSVMSVIWRPGKRPDPVIVEFRSGIRGTVPNVLLANSITLTPGTYTVLHEGDRFVVHCLRREYADGMENSRFIRILRRLK